MSVLQEGLEDQLQHLTAILRAGLTVCYFRLQAYCQHLLVVRRLAHIL